MHTLTWLSADFYDGCIPRRDLKCTNQLDILKIKFFEKNAMHFYFCQIVYSCTNETGKSLQRDPKTVHYGQEEFGVVTMERCP